ncbi:MAG TPA: hypothetical protein VMJ34_00175 [Bryobacteraceae bacterium]|nr:hypothetical protein [Bryobacteraceae bacterium]
MSRRPDLSLSLAPVEEEELTAETAVSFEEARASLDRGEGIPDEEILREFGLGGVVPEIGRIEPVTAADRRRCFVSAG